MKWNDNLYRVIIAGLWAVMLIQFQSWSSKMDKITDSVNDLNKNVAVVVQQTDFITSKNEDHENRLRDLEKKIK